MSDFSAITAAITAVQQSHVALVADLRAQILSKDAEIATMRQRLADMDRPAVHVASTSRKNLSANTKIQILRGEVLDRRIRDVALGLVAAPARRDPTTDSPSCITPAMWRTGGKHCPQQPEVGEVIAFLLATDSVMQKKQVTEHFSSKQCRHLAGAEGAGHHLHRGVKPKTKTKDKNHKKNKKKQKKNKKLFFCIHQLSSQARGTARIIHSKKLNSYRPHN